MEFDFVVKSESVLGGIKPKDLPKKQTRMYLSGKVQGVFFREFIKQNSNKLGLKGYVKNMKDGRVLAILQGSEKSRNELKKLSKMGPMLAKVDKIEASEEDISEEFEYFDIR